MKVDNTNHDTIPFCRRHQAISLLCANSPQILDDLFSDDRTGLRGSPALMFIDSRHYSDRERVLRWFAVGIWAEQTFVLLHEIYRFLEDYDFEGLILALECLWSSPRTACRCPFCRHAMISLPESEEDLLF
jgi:hypothetical protein